MSTHWKSAPAVGSVRHVALCAPHSAVVGDAADAPVASSSHHMRSICFVALNAYGALTGTETGYMGGIERQASLMARWFVRRRYRVSMITLDEGAGRETVVDGIRVITACRRDAGLPGVRFFHPRWTGLCRALRKADADLYFYNCGDLGLGQVTLWCRLHARICVYSVASNPSCDPRLPVLKQRRERMLYRYGVRHVHRIIAQTCWQQQMLQDGFGLPSTVLPMPSDGPSAADYRPPCPPVKSNLRVLWVGRISPVKRLEWLLDVAERCPDLSFDVVGASNGTSSYAAGLLRRASGLANVRIHGRVPDERILDFYERAAALCCTSEFEGFPNTFLEAWSRGLPVVSTFDPDGLIALEGLGRAADTVDDLIRGLRALLASPQEWRASSEAARRYYLTYHALDASMVRFEQIFADMLRTRRRSTPS